MFDIKKYNLALKKLIQVFVLCNVNLNISLTFSSQVFYKQNRYRYNAGSKTNYRKMYNYSVTV